MPTKLKRITMAMPSDILKKMDILKKDFFYAESYSQMFRTLLIKGAETYDCFTEQEISECISENEKYSVSTLK